MTAGLLQRTLRALLLWLGWAAPLATVFSQSAEPELSQQPQTSSFYPRLVTAETRANPQALAALERPGKVFFRDDFESSESLKKYIEVQGLKEGRAKLVSDAEVAHLGKGAIQFTSPAREGRESGGCGGKRLVWPRGL